MDPEVYKNANLYEPPPATPASGGSMNYSPRHSHKPASLLNLRNINMKHLLLNISPNTLPPRRKPPALSIPSEDATPTRRDSGGKEDSTGHGKDVRDGGSGRFTRDGGIVGREERRGSFGSLREGKQAELGTSRKDGLDGLNRDAFSPPGLPPWRSGLRSPFASAEAVADHLAGADLIDDSEISAPVLGRQLLEYTPKERPQTQHWDGSGLRGSGRLKNGSSNGASGNANSSLSSSSHHEYTFTIPEELQESLMVYAYPEGPANALNLTVFLFSDPKTSDFKLDINNYDLVINVAKECIDCSSQFDDMNGQKKYLYIPWSHTLKILHDLPEITRQMALMDKPGKKILVHCQCGVLRLACVVVAYFMTKFNLLVNEAYELLKSGTKNSHHGFVKDVSAEGNVVEACDRICPNMSLIFELMDFGERRKEG